MHTGIHWYIWSITHQSGLQYRQLRTFKLSWNLNPNDAKRIQFPPLIALHSKNENQVVITNTSRLKLCWNAQDRKSTRV